MQLGKYISDIHDGSVGFNQSVSDDVVIRNRQKIAEKNGFSPDRIVAMQQAHTGNCYEVSKKDVGSGTYSFSTGIKNVDGLLTVERNIVLLALSADCPLVSLYNEEGGVLAVVHSGWRGIINNIIPNMLDLMSKKYACNHKKTHALVAPMAGLCCYEIQEDVRTLFTERFSDEVVKETERGLFLDMKEALKQQLERNLVLTENTYISSACTICDTQYFSYRRQNVEAGRFGLFVWLK